MVITEALAEIKTITARLEKKKQNIGRYLVRPEALRDPLEKDGGSAASVAADLQSIQDLTDRVVELRRAINSANGTAFITINDTTKTISEWLTWRKEVAPFLRALYRDMADAIDVARRTASGAKQRNLGRAYGAADRGLDEIVAQEVVVNVEEKLLSADIERIESTLGALDGQLSLKNATVHVI